MPKFTSPTAVSPAEVPDEIKALAEQPISNASAPKGFSPLMNMNTLEKRIYVIEKALANYDQAGTQSIDIETASKLEGLFNQLDVLKKQQYNLQIDQESKIRQLENLEKMIEQQLYTERVCESRGHRREDGASAIGGVMVSGHGFVGTCMRCGKPFAGIGTEHGQVHPTLWASVNQNTIGTA